MKNVIGTRIGWVMMILGVTLFTFMTGILNPDDEPKAQESNTSSLPAGMTTRLFQEESGSGALEVHRVNRSGVEYLVFELDGDIEVVNHTEAKLDKKLKEKELRLMP